MDYITIIIIGTIVNIILIPYVLIKLIHSNIELKNHLLNNRKKHIIGPLSFPFTSILLFILYKKIENSDIETKKRFIDKYINY